MSSVSLAELWVSMVVSVLTRLSGMQVRASGNARVAHVIAGITAELSHPSSHQDLPDQVKPLPLDFSPWTRRRLLLAFVEIRVQGWG